MHDKAFVSNPTLLAAAPPEGVIDVVSVHLIHFPLASNTYFELHLVTVMFVSSVVQVSA